MTKQSKPTSQQIFKLLPIYFACLDHEAAVTHSHQNTLLGLQVGLLGIQYLSSEDMCNYLWILAFVGTAICFLLGSVYEYRVNNVDYWRKEIVSLIKETPLEKKFYQGGYGSSVVKNRWKKLTYPFRHWLTSIFIPLIILAWFLVLIKNPPNLTLIPLTQDELGIVLFLLLLFGETVWFSILRFLHINQGKNLSLGARELIA